MVMASSLFSASQTSVALPVCLLGEFHWSGEVSILIVHSAYWLTCDGGACFGEIGALADVINRVGKAETTWSGS